MAMAASDDGAQNRAASRMWHNACQMLQTSASRGDCGEDAWKQIVAASSSDDIWHSLKNCVTYQAGLWETLLKSGINDVMQPAAFQMAIVLRHTPSDLAVKILNDTLNSHPECEDLTSYVLALLTEEEARSPPSPAFLVWQGSPAGPAPPRDLQLYADCELAVLAAPRALYDTHARLVRNEYAHLHPSAYCDLRLKVLNQFSLLPNLFLSPEFIGIEAVARGNMHRELKALREQCY